MDLIPKPDQIVAAASNVAHKLLYGGVADLRPMPRTLIDEGLLREVYHYRPLSTARETGNPVLLVTPLAAPSSCYDLRRGCSLVEHLVQTGRPTYLVEYGEVSFRNRNLGMEHWIDEVVPSAIRAVSKHAGGKPVHVVGWSLGGIFSTLALADQPELPVATLTIVGSPFDLRKVPLIAPFRPLINANLPERVKVITKGYQAMGGLPKPLVRWAFQFSAVDKMVTKPLVKIQKLDDTEFLAQIEAVEAFTRNMIAYPGRSFGQLYHRMAKGNELVTGEMAFGDRVIEIGAVDVPVLVFGGAGDSIAPVQAVHPVVELLTGSPEVRWEIVPGGHLGMLTGRQARQTTWTILDGWMETHSGSRPARKARKAAKKAATRKAPARAKAEPGEGASSERIGSNPNRRYGSGGSRALST